MFLSLAHNLTGTVTRDLAGPGSWEELGSLKLVGQSAGDVKLAFCVNPSLLRTIGTASGEVTIVS